MKSEKVATAKIVLFEGKLLKSLNVPHLSSFQSTNVTKSPPNPSQLAVLNIYEVRLLV